MSTNAASVVFLEPSRVALHLLGATRSANPALEAALIAISLFALLCAVLVVGLVRASSR